MKACFCFLVEYLRNLPSRVVRGTLLSTLIHQWLYQKHNGGRTVLYINIANFWGTPKIVSPTLVFIYNEIAAFHKVAYEKIHGENLVLRSLY